MSILSAVVKFAAPILKGQVRHLVTALAGALVAAGAITPDQQTSFITIATGIVVWIAASAWSAYDKVQKGMKLEDALAYAFGPKAGPLQKNGSGLPEVPI